MNASWLWTPEGFAPSDSIPVSDRGFRYGMSVFESLPLLQGTPIFLSQHLERLRHACTQRSFEVDQRALASVDSLLRSAPFDGFARIYVTAGDGGVSDEITKPRVLVYLEQGARPEEGAYERGYALAICAEPIHPLFGGLKTGNYWSHIASLQDARIHGNDENLLLNESRKIISACMANLFLVHGDQIKTPDLESGARNGVTRQWVVDRRQVTQCVIGENELKNADEIFLTNSWLGIMPVASLGERPLPSRVVASRLHEEYVAEVEKLVERG